MTPSKTMCLHRLVRVTRFNTSQLARGADTVPASEQEHPTRSSDDGHSSTASTGVSDSTDPLVSASRNDRRKEDVAMLEMDSPGGSERPVVLREDGMPDWDVLTDRLPRQRKDFELTCFIENHETDTQVHTFSGWCGVRPDV